MRNAGVPNFFRTVKGELTDKVTMDRAWKKLETDPYRIPGEEHFKK